MTKSGRRGRLIKSKKQPRRFLFKAEWRGTALRFWIDAKNEKEAEHRAARKVMKMEGSMSCLGIMLEREA